jgi:uracil-DNA glycosylase family 4
MSQPPVPPRFTTDCRRCPRLVSFLGEVRAQFPAYYCAPVPPFGDPAAHLLVVGLAPGMHGANASGRPFTGDFAGILLYATLYRFGFASRAESRSAEDGLMLFDCRITNAVKCLPPANKPDLDEVRTCNPYLAAELAGLPAGAVVLALGAVAHGAVLRALEFKAGLFPFSHGAEHALGSSLRLLDSYHCSRYNTQTRRLTEPMFQSVVARARELLA